MIHKYVLVIVALTFLVPGTVFAANAQQSDDSTEATNSVKIFINGQQVEGPIQKGDVVHEGRRTDGECDNPSFRIQARGDVRRVKIGPDGNSCKIVVKVLELNYAQLPDPGTAFLTTAGYKWKLDTLSKIVGINSVDDLTKTRSSFPFKTPSFNQQRSLVSRGRRRRRKPPRRRPYRSSGPPAPPGKSAPCYNSNNRSRESVGLR